MKKKFAVAAAVTAGLCFAGGGHLKPAFAGHWEEVPADLLNSDVQTLGEYRQGTAEIEGTNAPSDGFSFTGNWADYSWQSPYSDPWHGDIGWFSAGVMGGPLQVTSSGKLCTKFRWVRDIVNGQPDPNDNPPASMNIKAFAGISTYGFNDTGNGLVSSISINDDEGVVDINGNYIGGQLYKTILSTIATNGEEEVSTPWVNYDGSYYSPFDGLGAYLGGEVDVSYSAVPDTRSLTISSSTIEPSYYKHYESPYWVPEPHVRQDDGSMTVDSVMKWFAPDESGTAGAWWGGGIFTADAANFTSPTYEWSVEGGVPSSLAAAAINAGTSSVTLPNDAYTGPTIRGIELGGTAKGNGFIDQSVFKVKVTDSDGAVGENTYTVNWHTPYENWVQTAEYEYPEGGQDIPLSSTQAGSTAQLTYNYDPKKVF